MINFAAIDFETANGKRTSVCSVGVVIVREGKITNKIYRLIRPRPNYYTQWTTAVHGLTYDDTMEADEFPEVWAEIKPLIDGLPLVAHNSPFPPLPFPARSWKSCGYVPRLLPLSPPALQIIPVFPSPDQR